MKQHSGDNMCGHQATQESQFKNVVHTFRMHHFFYGFTLMEALIVMMLLPLLSFPLSLLNRDVSEVDTVIQFKKDLYRSQVLCTNFKLEINDEKSPYSCQDIGDGIYIAFKTYDLYYVKP